MSLSMNEQYSKIYKYCYFKVRDASLAEDLTQETFLKYFSQDSYINRGKQLAYLYTIARNNCIDYFKERKLQQLDDEMAMPDTSELLETRIAVKTAVSLLPLDMQELILLKFTNGLGIMEIAEIMQISRFAVNRKLNAALKQLKSTLRKEDFS